VAKGVHGASPRSGKNKKRLGEKMSHYVNRPLLYVSRHHDASLCRYLSQHGWKLVFANSLEDLAAATRWTILGGPARFPERLQRCRSRTDGALAGDAPDRLDRCDQLRDELTDTARKLLGLYFIDYYTAPFDMAEAKPDARTRGWHGSTAGARATGRAADAPHGIIGECNAMQALFRSIERCRGGHAGTDLR
jgi:hypothetical protein